MRSHAHCTVVPASPTPLDIREYLSTRLFRRGCAFQTLERGGCEVGEGKLVTKKRGSGFFLVVYCHSFVKGIHTPHSTMRAEDFFISFVVVEAEAEAGFLWCVWSLGMNGPYQKREPNK
jgi:hypothetical protein